MQNYQNLKKKFNELKAERDYIKSALAKEVSSLNLLKQEYEDALAARAILQTVAELTQKNLESHISGLVTLAINSVFPEECKFGIEFQQKRNRTECIFYIEKYGNRIYSLLDAEGGGLGDIISIALRIAFYKLDKGLPIFFMDEPIKFLNSEECKKNVSDLLKMLSTKFNIQFIVVSDQDCLEADKTFRIVNGTVVEVN